MQADFYLPTGANSGRDGQGGVGDHRTTYGNVDEQPGLAFLILAEMEWSSS